MKMLPAVLLALAVPGSTCGDEKKDLPYDPTSAYAEMKVEGWLVRINKKLGGYA